MSLAQAYGVAGSRFDPAPPDRAGSGARGLRIALFSGNYNCVRDGANNALNRLAAHLLAQGAEVRVYSPTAAVPAFEPVGELVSVPSIGIPGRPEYRVGLGLPRHVREDIGRFRPTHFHLSAPDLLGKQAQRFARRNGIPVVTSLHTRFETYLEYYRLGALRPLANRYLRAFYSGSDHILAPNRAMAVWLRELGVRSEISIWGRGVDRSLFSPRRRDMNWRRQRGYKDDEVVILFFGRLVMEKGLRTFVEIVRSLEGRGQSVRPLVVGEGPARRFMEEHLPNAALTGHLEGADLGKAVASADILVNPSVTEAFGNVNLEAMASGLAVVSADVPSARILLANPRVGLLVKPNDAEAFADGVEGLIMSPRSRDAIGADAARAASAYDWNRVFDPVVDAYGAALHCSSTSGFDC